MRFFILLTVFSAALCCAEELPPVDLADVRTATVQLVTVSLPEIRLPKLLLPEIRTIEGVMATPADLTVDQSSLPAAVSVPLAVIQGVGEQLSAAADILQAKSALFRDQRTFLYDRNAHSGSEEFSAWVDVYKNHTPYIAAHIPLDGGIKMIAELRLPVSLKVLDENLRFYKEKRYNSVLITFDGSEEPYQLAELADRVKSAGMSPWFAFGGAEDLKLSIFVHPQKLGRIIRALAPHCRGMLLHWRRTSLHLLLPDRPFLDFLLKTAREANPAIQVLGQSYYGTNSGSDEKFAVATSMPDNASGVLVGNVGYIFYSPKKVFRNLFPRLDGIKKVILVLGDRPYYATRNKNNLSFEQNFEFKTRVEERFLSAGAAGTITLHGDGSNGIYDATHTDNLGHTGR